MVLALPVAAGIVLALALGGDPRRLADLRLRRIEFFFAAVALQLVAFPLAFMPWQTGDGAARALWLVSYSLLCTAALLNVRVAGVPVIAAGMACNIAAVVANGGRMPALPGALRDAGKTLVARNNSVPSAEPRLPWLVDRWAVPHWIPFGNVFSVGDAAIAVGVLLLVVAATTSWPLLPFGSRRRAAGVTG